MTSRVGQELARRLSAWVETSARHPWKIVAACALLALASAAVARGLGFRGDFAELLPESTAEVKDLRFVEARAGGVGYLIVQVTGGSAEARSSFAAQLAFDLEAQPELVRYVEHRLDAAFFRTRALWLLPVEKLEALREELAARLAYEKRRANPLLVDLLEEEAPPPLGEIARRYAPPEAARETLQSKDGRETYLFVKPRGSVADLQFNRRLIAAVQRAVEARRAGAPGLSVGLTGSYLVRVEEDDAMRRDLARASLASVVLALGIIVLATRRAAALAVVFLPVAAGIAFTFGVARVAVGHLNPITGFLAAVLVGLGIEYGVHLTLRFSEERTKSALVPALRAAVHGTAGGALTSALTNAAALGALCLAELSAFRQFGFLAAVGVMATVAAAYVLGPALLVLTDGWSKQRGSPPAPLEGRGGRARPGSAMRPFFGWALIAALAGFAGWSWWVRDTVGFETDMRALRGASRSTDLNVHVSAQLGVIMNPALVHVATLDEAWAVTRLARERSAERKAATSIDRAVCLADLLPRDVARHRAAIASLDAVYQALPRSVREDQSSEGLATVRAMLDAEPWSEGELPAEARRRFTALEGGGYLVLIFPRYQSFDTRETDLWADDLTAVVDRARAAGIDARVLDGNRLASRILRLVRSDGPPIMLRAALAVFLMIWVGLRRLGDAALVAGPLYLGLLCLVGVMHACGLKLNFFNIVVLPSLLAIAVDNSVHLFHRYRHEGPGSLGRVLRSTGFAAVAATLSNAAGYATLLVAQHTGLRSIAWLAIAGVACTFVGTTVVFPLLLALREQRRGHLAGAPRTALNPVRGL